jgi:hypothetical protein
MSETEEATSTIPTEGLYGRELENAKSGFTTRKKDESAEQATPDNPDDGDPIREAAANREASRDKILELSVSELHERDLTEAVTLPQAAQDWGSAQRAVSTFTEGLDLANLADEVDQKRAEVIKGDPKVAKHLGVEMPAKEGAPADPLAIRDNAKTDAAASDDVLDHVEGLTPETRAALRVPQIRSEIERHFNEIDHTQKSYVEGVSQAQRFALASFIDAVPEIAHLPAERRRDLCRRDCHPFSGPASSDISAFSALVIGPSAASAS